MNLYTTLRELIVSQIDALVESGALPAGLDTAAITVEPPRDVAVRPYLDAYDRFVRESGFRAERMEFEVRHDVWRYVGHPDILGWLNGQRILVDVKTGALGPVAYQLAAYRLAWEHQHPDAPIQAIASLALHDTGKYHFTEYERGESEAVWLAAVTVYRAQER